MGIDREIWISFGFPFDQEDLIDAFGVTVPEEVRLEDRFDAKTGEKLEPEEIMVNPEIQRFKLDGIVFTGSEADDPDLTAASSYRLRASTVGRKIRAR